MAIKISKKIKGYNVVKPDEAKPAVSAPVAAEPELATAEGISKNDVVRRAILDRHTRTIRRRDVDEATTWAREHYRSLLDRLAQ